jgi:hypothetical protein
MQKRRKIRICSKRVDQYVRELAKAIGKIDEAKIARETRNRELTQQDRQDIQYHGAAWNS